MTSISDTSLLRTPFGVRIRDATVLGVLHFRYPLLIGEINISFLVFVFEILLPQKRKLDPLKSFKYHKHQHKGNKVWTVSALTTPPVVFIFNPGYNFPFLFFITPQGMLWHCFFLHVDSNSLDVTEKSVFGLATYETFLTGIWDIMGYNVFKIYKMSASPE